MSETVGYIYILTNPSFPEYVKIGYANNVERRLKELNRSECTPFAFRIYATYEVSNELTDKNVHSIIDKLNPSLRSIDYIDGKQRKREFYAMSKEDAYSLLEAIAEINGFKKNLVKYAPTEEERIEEEEAETVRLEAFAFSKCGLKAGEKIHYINNESIVCEIVSDKKVLYENVEYSLSSLAKKLLNVSYGVAGPHYFTYNGERLCDIREKVENESSN